MDFYGLFVNVEGKTDFIEIEPQKLINREADGTLKYQNASTKEHSYFSALKYDYFAQEDPSRTLGIRVRDAKQSSGATEIQFAQARGDMHMHRPVYLMRNDN